MALTLFTGPRNCGKSLKAEQFANYLGGSVTYVGTLPNIGEHRERIRRHRAQRPETWPTVSLTGDLDYDGAILSKIRDQILLFDGLATYVGRCLLFCRRGVTPADMTDCITALLYDLNQTQQAVIVVSTDGTDLPPNPGQVVHDILIRLGQIADDWVKIGPRME